MSPEQWIFRLEDILESVRAIQDYTEGLDFEAFVSDRKTVDAVIRNLIVIGEAAGRIPDDVRRKHPGLPWADMKDMRNFVVHEYFRISDQIVWETVESNRNLRCCPSTPDIGPPTSDL